jgi:2-(1,2-epoxy-1,2-dihydrophenyl)acetyl-CoA isomerase
MEIETIEVLKENGICLLTLNKPEVRNSLTVEMRKELTFILKEISNDVDVKVVIITGKGPVFSSGGDLKSLQNEGIYGVRKRLQTGHELINIMLNLEKPIIAAVNGPAVGAGFSLALACDLIIASESASFIPSFSKVGLVPDLGSAYFITKLVGPFIAKKLLFLGEKISSQQAYGLQIVNEVVANEDLLDTANTFAKRLTKGPNITYGLTKLLVNRSVNTNLKEVLEIEALFQSICFSTEDFKEGVVSFFEKRIPDFKGK